MTMDKKSVDTISQKMMISWHYVIKNSAVLCQEKFSGTGTLPQKLTKYWLRCHHNLNNSEMYYYENA